MVLTAPSDAGCGPSRLGQPCPQAGLAVAPPGQGMLDPSVGNPVHAVTGNKHQFDVDLPAHWAAPALALQRHYNSLDPRMGSLGRGWTWSYDTRLFGEAGRWQILQADGSRVSFEADGQAQDRAQGRLRRWAGGQRWDWPDGSQRWFDHAGFLVRLRLPGQPVVHIQRQAGPGPLTGALREVAGGGGWRLSWHYGAVGGRPVVRRVDTPLGAFHYDYEQATDGQPRLVTVTRPDGLQRRYHHESWRQTGHAHALTGMSLVDGAYRWRARTWTYDARGRAVQQWAAAAASIPPDASTVPGQAAVRAADTAPAGMALGGAGRRAVALGAYWSVAPEGAAAVSDAAGYRHDASGRLLSVPGVTLQWRGDAVAAVTVSLPGWPGLRWQYGPEGRRIGWSSDATGVQTQQYSAGGLPVQRRYGQGGMLHTEYDRVRRPIRLHASLGADQVTVRLGWRGQRLVRVEHPLAREHRLHDRLGRLHQRREWRRDRTGGWRRYVDTWHYDGAHRVVRHDLPEGGAVLTDWAPDGRVARVRWRDAQGREQVVLDSTAGQPGYRYGNGLWLISAGGVAGVTRLALMDGPRVRWRQQVWFDVRGRVREERHEWPALAPTQHLRYGHDEQDRLVVAETLAPAEDAVPSPRRPAQYYQWQADGTLAARGDETTGRQVEVRDRDAGGLPRHADGWQLVMGAQQRPRQMRRADGVEVTASYDAHGHRIRRQVTRGGEVSHQDFLYVDRQLAALADERGRITTRYLYVGWTPVGMIHYPEVGPPALYFVHADLAGAPRLVTDAVRETRWAAHYAPFGRATRVAGDLDFGLRLPGQWEDPVTGWHDNVWRDYLPDQGHYLTPDPLGPQPGSQAYGYAAQQPRRYVDPLGLLLFAFDGTRYDAQVGGNVWALSQRYQDGAVYYEPGPGNPQDMTWDAITAWRAPQILERQWRNLLDALRQAPGRRPVPIDILGYSRGAAMARHFAQQIADRVTDGRFVVDDPLQGRLSVCVDLRFLGLFDTVAQFGLGGWRDYLYDLGIAPTWAWVAHAVALHERRILFPLVPAGDAGHIVERPFIGAHADIGGGVLPLEPEGTGTDLPDVALGWMWWQARAASVPLAALAAEQQAVTAPWMRDFRSAAERIVLAGDRAVRHPTGRMAYTYQHDHPTLGAAVRDEVEAFIRRDDGWHPSQGSAGDVAGEVDWARYRAWLGVL